MENRNYKDSVFVDLFGKFGQNVVQLDVGIKYAINYLCYQCFVAFFSNFNSCNHLLIKRNNSNDKNGI